MGRFMIAFVEKRSVFRNQLQILVDHIRIRYNRGNGAEEVIPGGFTVEGYTGSAMERYVKRMHHNENLYHVAFKDEICFHWWTDRAVTISAKQRYPHLRPGPLPKAADPGTHHNLRR